MRALPYISVYLLPVATAFSFILPGWWTFTALAFGFGFIPLVELLLGTNATNLSAEAQRKALSNPLYDLLLYSTVPLLFALLVWFLIQIGSTDVSPVELIGRISAMGLILGVLGINVAHELGHRVKKSEQFLAKLLLLSSQYMHFYVEHNKGHHKNVGTHEDPASARLNEPIYVFWVRTVVMSYISAWKIQNKERSRKGYSFFDPKNEMIWFQLIQAASMTTILLVFDWQTMLYYLAAAVMGMLLLETVNYIEHYGLRRKKVNEHRYEDVMPMHSWNSDHIVGRLMLFELTRHSDHHFQAQKKYQVLESIPQAPQLPAGYPGMMLLSLLSPLFFWVMNPRVKRISGS